MMVDVSFKGSKIGIGEMLSTAKCSPFLYVNWNQLGDTNIRDRIHEQYLAIPNLDFKYYLSFK